MADGMRFCRADDPDGYRGARREHAWLLRAEGLSFADIGSRLGVGAQGARHLVRRFGWLASWATRRTKWRIDK